jgi:hypothetical protein
VAGVRVLSFLRDAHLCQGEEDIAQLISTPGWSAKEDEMHIEGIHPHKKAFEKSQ